jgi:hypothetical protein
MNLSDLETCLAASEKLTRAYVDLEAQTKGNAAAEGAGDAVWRQDFSASTVGYRLTMERLTAAVKVLQARLHKNKYLLASQAVDRALREAKDVMTDNDPDEVEEVRQQLSARMREMEAAAVHLDDNQFLQDGGKLQETEKSLRKLAKKKWELLQQEVGVSPNFPSPQPQMHS